MKILIITAMLFSVQGYADSTNTQSIFSFQRIFSRISVQSIYTTSQIESTMDMNYYFSPTTKNVKHNSIGGGIEIESYVFPFTFITWGAEVVVKGETSKKTKVRLYTDPFTHDFESKAIFKHLSFPIHLKLEMPLPFSFFGVQGGIVMSRLVDKDMAWVIDGEESNFALGPRIRDKDISYSFGIEGGFVIRNHGLFIAASKFKSMDTFAKDLEGEAFFKGWQIHSGYRLFLGRMLSKK